MAKINLLPWRQAYREEKKREFVSIMVGVGLFSCIVAYAWVHSVETAIANQNSRNALLDTKIAELELQVKEIAEIKKVREDLLARIKVIQDLEGTRPVIVRHFDDFVRTIPDGVFITSMDRKGTSITLEGIAESYNRVSAFLRNLDDSDWFADPKLFSVTAAPSEGEQANSFRMTVTSTVPEPVVDTNSPVKGGKK